MSLTDRTTLYCEAGTIARDLDWHSRARLNAWRERASTALSSSAHAAFSNLQRDYLIPLQQRMTAIHTWCSLDRDPYRDFPIPDLADLDTAFLQCLRATCDFIEDHVFERVEERLQWQIVGIVKDLNELWNEDVEEFGLLFDEVYPPSPPPLPEFFGEQPEMEVQEELETEMGQELELEELELERLGLGPGQRRQWVEDMVRAAEEEINAMSLWDPPELVGDLEQQMCTLRRYIRAFHDDLAAMERGAR